MQVQCRYVRPHPRATRQERHDALLKGWARLHALIALQTMLMSCVSARHEAMSRLRATPLLSFLDQFNLSARSPLANEPNNLALTLREVEERLPNRTPRARVFLCNSFEKDRASFDRTWCLASLEWPGGKNIDRWICIVKIDMRIMLERFYIYQCISAYSLYSIIYFTAISSLYYLMYVSIPRSCKQIK